jgi:hypothetical protein
VLVAETVVALLIVVIVVTVTVVSAHAYSAKKAYLHPSIVTLAQRPVPCRLANDASPEGQTDVLTLILDGQLAGLPGQKCLLWSSPKGPQWPVSQYAVKSRESCCNAVRLVLVVSTVIVVKVTVVLEAVVVRVMLLKVVVVTVTVVSEHVYSAKKPYSHPSMATLAHRPVPCRLSNDATPEGQVEVLTLIRGGQMAGLPGHRSLL